MGPVAAIAVVLGGVLSAVSAISQAKSKSDQLKSNAQIAEANAAEAQFQSQEQARLKRQQLNRLIGRQKAGFAKGGVRTTEGTPLLITEETEQEGQRDIDLTLRAGNIESLALRNQASRFKKQAKEAKTAGFLGAATSLLGAVGPSGLFSGGGSVTSSTPFKSTGGFRPSIVGGLE